MCKNPRNPKNPNPSREEEEEEGGGGGGGEGREVRKQALVEDLSLKLRDGDPLARVEAARDIRKLARASPRARSAFVVPAVVDPLVSMLSSPYHLAKESALLALLNLAVRNQCYMKLKVGDPLARVEAGRDIRKLAWASPGPASPSWSPPSSIPSSPCSPRPNTLPRSLRSSPSSISSSATNDPSPTLK